MASIKNLIILVIFWSLFLTLLIISIKLSAALLLIKNGLFLFDINDLIYSIKSGFASGTIAGIGLWIFSKITKHRK